MNTTRLAASPRDNVDSAAARASTDWDAELPTRPDARLTMRELFTSMRPACPTCGAVLYRSDDGLDFCLALECAEQGAAVLS